MHFAIVTFNNNEAKAINALFDDLVNKFSFSRKGSDGVYLVSKKDVYKSIHIKHYSLMSQGNVVAATVLANLFSNNEAIEKTDFFIFYGCAGVINPKKLQKVFLVSTVSYLSLGTVKENRGKECITLKNKWLCHTIPPGDKPLNTMYFPAVSGTINNGKRTTSKSLAVSTQIPVAHVAATDKVINISLPKSSPKPLYVGANNNTYGKQEWTYGQALKYTEKNIKLPILVEMESYGIAMVAEALKIGDKVVVIRVATDSLVDKDAMDNEQEDWLKKFNAAVFLVIQKIVEPV